MWVNVLGGGDDSGAEIESEPDLYSLSTGATNQSPEDGLRAEPCRTAAANTPSSKQEKGKNTKHHLLHQEDLKD